MEPFFIGADDESSSGHAEGMRMVVGIYGKDGEADTPLMVSKVNAVVERTSRVRHVDLVDLHGEGEGDTRPRLRPRPSAV